MVGDHNRKGTTMGDRAQIAVKMGNAKKGRVYLYAHWAGAALFADLQAALQRRERWQDAEYLARIIFQEMIGDDRGSTGFGIGTAKHGDLEHPVPVLDCENGRITWEAADFGPDEHYYRASTFEEFAKHGAQLA
jgi:hypothetical protein